MVVKFRELLNVGMTALGGMGGGRVGAAIGEMTGSPRGKQIGQIVGSWIGAMTGNSFGSGATDVEQLQGQVKRRVAEKLYSKGLNTEQVSEIMTHHDFSNTGVRYGFFQNMANVITTNIGRVAGSALGMAAGIWAGVKLGRKIDQTLGIDNPDRPPQEATTAGIMMGLTTGPALGAVVGAVIGNKWFDAPPDRQIERAANRHLALISHELMHMSKGR
jgi:hypothetical protein